MSRILMVLPAADTWSRTAEVLHEKLVQAGGRVDVAAPGGLGPPGRRGAEYDVVAIPGGDGPAEDRDPELGRLLVDTDAAGRIIAAVRHGPGALLAVRTPEGWWPFAGRNMTASSELATRLRELGAYYESGPESEAYVVRDGNLITGRNLASTGRVAETVLEELGAPHWCR